MAKLAESGASIHPPNITQADLDSFHKSHFSNSSLEHFSLHFLGPVAEEEYVEEEEEEEEEEDDGLGYYPDGVKRTLTDEQIAIFRHSEIQALLRERRHAEENGNSHRPNDDPAGGSEEGELEENLDIPAENPGHDYEAELPPKISIAKKKKKKGAQKGKQKDRGIFKLHIKPDLRKRTWDKVDDGLGSLDYGEEEDRSAAQPAAAQRRRISYEDV